MSTKRKSIRLLEHEKAVIVKLYLKRRIPIDQYENRPVDLAGLVDEWRDLTGRTDGAGDLIHYMRTQRKRGRWVTFGSDYEPVPPKVDFTADETEILVAIFYENVTMLESGSDNLAYEDDVALLIAKEFADQAGRYVAPHELVAKLTALRKRRMLPTVGERQKEIERQKDVEGFEDIDDVDMKESM